MAAATTKDLANLDGFNYEVTWKGTSIGWVKDVDLSGLQPKMFERKIGELNNITIDRVHKGGLEGTLKTTLHEVKVDRIRQLKTWAASTGAFTVSPSAEYFAEYANAGPLIFHPRGASTTADDVTFLHAYPKTDLPTFAGEEDRVMSVEWNVYPDRTALIATPSTIVYGYHGPAPE